jgi:hypothetical protein
VDDKKAVLAEIKTASAKPQPDKFASRLPDHYLQFDHIVTQGVKDKVYICAAPRTGQPTAWDGSVRHCTHSFTRTTSINQRIFNYIRYILESYLMGIICCLLNIYYVNHAVFIKLTIDESSDFK